MRIVTIFGALIIAAVLSLAISAASQEYRVIDGGAIGTQRGSTVIDVSRDGKTRTYLIDNWGSVGRSDWKPEDEIPERYRTPEPLDTSDLDFKPWKKNP